MIHFGSQYKIPTSLADASYHQLSRTMAVDFVAQLQGSATARGYIYSFLLLWLEIPIYMCEFRVFEYLFGRELLPNLLRDAMMVFLVKVDAFKISLNRGRDSSELPLDGFHAKTRLLLWTEDVYALFQLRALVAVCPNGPVVYHGRLSIRGFVRLLLGPP